MVAQSFLALWHETLKELFPRGSNAKGQRSCQTRLRVAQGEQGREGQGKRPRVYSGEVAGEWGQRDNAGDRDCPGSRPCRVCWECPGNCPVPVFLCPHVPLSPHPSVPGAPPAAHCARTAPPARHFSGISQVFLRLGSRKEPPNAGSHGRKSQRALTEAVALLCALKCISCTQTRLSIPPMDFRDTREHC